MPLGSQEHDLPSAVMSYLLDSDWLVNALAEGINQGG
jgi:hypothetical protein